MGSYSTCLSGYQMNEWIQADSAVCWAWTASHCLQVCAHYGTSVKCMVTGESFNDVVMLYRNGSKTESCEIIGSLHTRDEALTDCIASKQMANTCIV